MKREDDRVRGGRLRQNFEKLVQYIQGGWRREDEEEEGA